MGTEGMGYVSGSDRRAVILVHEIFGVTAHIRTLADRFAEAGFTASAIDLFDGRTTDDLQQGFALAQALSWPNAVKQIQRAAEALRAESRPVAVVGFCMGGSLALMAAAQAPAPWPTVCFYGIPPSGQADLTRISGHVLLHFATQDTYISNERINALEHLLEGAGVRATLHRYAAAHGFVREDPDGFAAKLAWERTITFLRQELVSG